MKLSRPMPYAFPRALQLLQDSARSPTGQQLPECGGHRLAGFELSCYGGPGAPLVADQAGWPDGLMPQQVAFQMYSVCWLKTLRRKRRAAEYLQALHDRSARIITGYQTHAQFEVAAHMWLCVTAAGGDLDVPCDCPKECTSWFKRSVDGTTAMAHTVAVVLTSDLPPPAGMNRHEFMSGMA